MWSKAAVKTARALANNGHNRVVAHSRWFSAQTDLDHLFRRAVQHLQSPASPETIPVSNQDKLKIYALFKQSEQGPCTGPRPGMFDPVGRAKYDAWAALGAISSEQAKQQYVDFIVKLLGPLKEGAVPAAEPVKEAVQAQKPASAVGGGLGLSSLEEIIRPRHRSAKHPLTYTHLTVSIDQGIAHVVLNRPTKGNAFNVLMWAELTAAMKAIGEHPDAKVVILSGANGNFSTGMEIKVFLDYQALAATESCEGRKREGLEQFITFLQDAVTSLEKCPLPVITAVSGNCIGGAIDVITAADMRYCTDKASFCVKEIDLAIVADMGTLQRLPGIVGTQRCAELCYTARTFNGREAVSYGLAMQAFATEAEMMTHVQEVAKMIASKSPLTIRGVKKSLLYAKDHTVAEGLEQVKAHNMAMLMSTDLVEAAMAMMEKRKPDFKDV